MRFFRWIGGSIRIQIILWNVCVLALILALLGVTLRYTLHASLVAGIDRELTNRARGRSHVPPADRRAMDYANRMQARGPRDEGAPQQQEFGGQPGPDGQPGSDGRPAIAGGQDFDGRPAIGGRQVLDGRPGAGGPQGMRGQLGGLGPRGERGTPPMERSMDPQQRDLFSRSPLAPYDPEGFRLALQGQNQFRTVTVDGQETRVCSMVIREGPPGSPPEGEALAGVVQTAQPLTDVNQEVADLTRTLMTLIPLGLIITALGGAFLANRALHPVQQITRAAERIGAQDLSRRLPVTGRDEFSRLAGTFNAMLERIERAFAQQRRFTGDASHELRTPLAVIKLNTSLALRGQRTAAEYREALETVDRAADQTTGIVQDLLLLARADAGQIRADQAPTSVADAARSAWDLAHGAVDHPPALHTDIPPDLCVRARPDDLTRLLRNLLDNAVRHTPPDGSITVKALASGHQATISITDTGEGIAQEHLPHIFERFYRVDAARGSARGGTGLGLAICEAIAHSCGGSLTISSKLGAGTTLTITLPAAPAAIPTKIYARTPPRISS
jgi:heavy metal sensor kinase